MAGPPIRLSRSFKVILIILVAIVQNLSANNSKFAIATVDPIATNAGIKAFMDARMLALLGVTWYLFGKILS